MDNEIRNIDTIENLKDLMALAQAADMKGRNDDVEQLLQQFYRKQKVKKAKARQCAPRKAYQDSLPLRNKLLPSVPPIVSCR